MPVYNASQYIRDTVHSVLCQTYHNFELIMVDDGSKDYSGTICDELAGKDCRVKVIHKSNGGISDARNHGLDVAQGEFITFCDDDDYVFPNWLEILLDNIGERDLLISGFRSESREKIKDISNRFPKIVDEETIVIDKLPEMRVKFPQLDANNKGSVWRHLFRRSIIEKYHLRFEKIQYEDLLFCYEYYLHTTSLKYIDFPAYIHISTPCSAGSNHRYIAEYPWISRLENLHDAITEQFGINDELYQARLRGRFAIHASSYLLKGYYPECFVDRRTRLARWRQMRKDPWMQRLKFREVSSHYRDLFVIFLCKAGLYMLFDCPFLWMAKIYTK